MLFCYQDLIRLASFNTVCLRDPTQMSPESGSGTPLKQLRLIARPSSSSPSWAAMPRNPPPHAAVGTPSTCSSSASYSPLVVLCPMQFCGQASLVDFFFVDFLVSLRFLWRFSGFASSQRAHAFVEDPARAMSLSRCAANLLAVKLVRVARGMEHGLALQAISPGLVDGALGEYHIFMLGPL